MYIAEQDREACSERRAVMPALASCRQTTKVGLSLVPQYLSGGAPYSYLVTLCHSMIAE